MLLDLLKITVLQPSIFYQLKTTKMKKLIFMAFLTMAFTACNDSKTKEGELKPAKKEDLKPTSDDKAMKEWMQGKEWKAESEAAPITTMRLGVDGICDYIAMKDPWAITEGNFVIGSNSLSAKYPCTKVDDQSFTLYVKPSDKTYTYRFVKNL